ncbi:MAG: glycerophosphodiester phosphodiesterase [Alphaproteobacteria bacterium]|nr:glycerophosphodiester phosphodiesterase [Alphaproteobacteria bacterium]
MSILIVGHRGASGHLPENTLPAFEKAIELKADGVELDIWPDADGVPMVIHDEKLSRTTPHKGKVTAMHSDDLIALGVPSYQQVLDLAHDKLIVFTELKGEREDQVGATIAAAVANDGWQYEQLPVISFNHAQLTRLKNEYPDILIGLSFSKRMLNRIPADQHVKHMITQAKSHNAVAINPDYHFVTKALVDAAHAEGLSVNVWTVNTPAAMREMIALSVDAIMTDYPDTLYTLLHDEPQR